MRVRAKVQAATGEVGGRARVGSRRAGVANHEVEAVEIEVASLLAQLQFRGLHK